MIVAESFCDECGQNGNKKMSLIYGEFGGKILGLGGLKGIICWNQNTSGNILTRFVRGFL